MARKKHEGIDETVKITPNQIVAFNLTEARRLRGWTQEEAAAELERLSADDIEEAYHINPIYDRLKAVVAHERVLRNQLDRVALAADNAIDLCNLLSAHVEEANPSEDDSL